MAFPSFHLPSSILSSSSLLASLPSSSSVFPVLISCATSVPAFSSVLLLTVLLSLNEERFKTIFQLSLQHSVSLKRKGYDISHQNKPEVALPSKEKMTLTVRAGCFLHVSDWGL